VLEISFKLRVGLRRPRPQADPDPPYVEDGPAAHVELAPDYGYPELHSGVERRQEQGEDPDDRGPRIGFRR